MVVDATLLAFACIMLIFGLAVFSNSLFKERQHGNNTRGDRNRALAGMNHERFVGEYVREAIDKARGPAAAVLKALHDRIQR